MAIITRLPGDLKANDKSAFGGAYPIHPGNTGFNNIEVATYPAATTDLIMPVVSPVDPNKVAIRTTVEAGSGQPHYPGSAGERSEIWWEPHSRVEGTKDAICASWFIPLDFDPGDGWSCPFQLHAADGIVSEPDYDGDPSPPYALEFTNDDPFQVQFQQKWVKRHKFGPLLLGHELFMQWYLDHSKSNGKAQLWLSWDRPPAADARPFAEWGGVTHWGGGQWYKTGNYRGHTKVGSSVIYTTGWAFDDAGSLAAARADVGWGATHPPPPPPGGTVKGSIKQGETLKGTIVWTADNGPCDFTIDGKLPWHENFAPFVYNGNDGVLDTKTLTDGPHVFTVALSDGSDSHSVTATVANTVVLPPPPAPTNAELAKLADTAFRATTVSYATWKKNLDAGKYPDPLKTQWGQGFHALDQIQ